MAEEKAKAATAAALKAGGQTKGLFMLVAALAAVVIGTGAGFGVGKIMGGSSDGGETAKPPDSGGGGHGGGGGGEHGGERPKEPPGKFIYLDLEPITGMINHPTMNRYIRLGITLKMKTDNSAEVEASVKKMSPEIKNEITTYMSGFTVEDISKGTPQFLNKIRRELCEKFNQILWPNPQKFLIEEVLLKEFVLQ
ncbi:MAG: flagellar basal body-associated FliL family protein [Planctomycetes bacterium]|nr:flagellar basal body-associated FliL family protein [Planctomycetota bacterium]